MKNFKIFSKNKLNNKKIISTFKDKIIYKKINFQYNQNKNFEFNFTIKKGEKILLTGPSGSGKSTLLNILSGLITNFKGSVLIDNTVFTNKDYSTNLYGYIIQQPFLFSGTIYENITFKR